MNLRTLKISTCIVLAIAVVFFSIFLYLGYTLNRTMAAEDSDIVKRVNNIEEMIRNGQFDESLQKEIELSIASDRRIKKLLLFNEYGTVIAAYPQEAIGEKLPMVFMSSILNSHIRLPGMLQFTLPQVLGSREAAYRLHYPDNDISRFYGTFKDSQNSSYTIMTTHSADPNVIAKSEGIRKQMLLISIIGRVAAILFWILLALWVFKDAQSRKSNAAAWGILTLFTSIVGWTVYLLGRPQLLQCPNCQAYQDPNVHFCTSCGNSLKINCPECGGEIEDEWTYCGNCGAGLSE